MRLSVEQPSVIERVSQETLGAHGSVRVFGSRLAYQMAVGDIDLLFETTDLLPRRAHTICHIHGGLVMALGDQKIDVLLKDARPSSASVVVHAQRTGTLL